MPPFGVKTYFGFIGRKDADYASLMDAVDAAILKMKADGRMAEMQQKWFGATFDTPDKRDRRRTSDARPPDRLVAVTWHSSSGCWSRRRGYTVAAQRRLDRHRSASRSASSSAPACCRRTGGARLPRAALRQLLPRRAAARATAADLQPAARHRPQRAERGRGDRRPVALHRRLSGGEPARRLRQRAAGPARGRRHGRPVTPSQQLRPHPRADRLPADAARRSSTRRS